MDRPETRDAVVDMCMLFHQNVRGLAARFQRELQRNVYVTPTSYLELITTYQTLLASKRQEVHTKLRRYEVGHKLRKRCSPIFQLLVARTISE
jgi:dynein heavy chain